EDQEDEPEDDVEGGGDPGHQAEEEDGDGGEDSRPGEEEEVDAEHPGNGARSADHGDVRVQGREDKRRHRADSAEEIEGDEAAVAHHVLDVVAEDPEIEEVAAHVEEGAMGEHAGEDGGDRLGEGLDSPELRGHESQGEDRGLERRSPAELPTEDAQVGHDQEDRDEGDSAGG